MQNNVNSNISRYEGHTITSLGKILKFSKFYVQNIWQIVRWWHHQLTHFAYSYRLVKKCFVKICETSKCHNFLIFQPIFIRFSLLCLKIFTLSSEIKLNLLWSSPLTLWSLNLKFVWGLLHQKFKVLSGCWNKTHGSALLKYCPSKLS